MRRCARVNRRGARLPLLIGSITLAISFYYFYAFHDTQAQAVFGLIIVSAGMGFVIVSIINITVQSVSQIETGIATAMNTIFRTIGAVIGPAIAGYSLRGGLFLARYVSPLVAQASFGSVMGPLVPNESVRLCIPRRAGRLARRQRDGAFSKKMDLRSSDTSS